LHGTFRIVSAVLHSNQSARLTSATLYLKDSKFELQVQSSWTKPPLWGLDVRRSAGDEGTYTRL